MFLFGCSEVNSTLLITSKLTSQNARTALFTSVVYTNGLKSLYGTCVFLNNQRMGVRE